MEEREAQAEGSKAEPEWSTIRSSHDKHGSDGQNQGGERNWQIKQRRSCSLPITTREIEKVALLDKVARPTSRRAVKSLLIDTTSCDLQLDVRNLGQSRSEVKEIEENDKIQLSDKIWMFRNRKLSQHGSIYLGEQRNNVFGNRLIVIKLALNDKYSRTEAKILAKLSENPHTNILPLIHSDVCQCGLEEYLYIAMEKCHSENLGQFVMNRRDEGCSFDYKFSIVLAQQIISGVEFIHSKNIIHKDLKPDNILFSLDQTVIRIADFGISEEIQSSSARVFKKAQFGTNGYRPSESYGNGIISLKTDIFSLGAVLYFLLSNGEHPFGNIPELWSYNVKKDLGMDLSGLLVPNAKTAEHLIRCMLSFKRCNRPTIRDVSSHPCWTGNEVGCNFDYECEESDVDQPQISYASQPCIIPSDRIALWQKFFKEKDKCDRQPDTSQQAISVATDIIGSSSDAVQSSEDKGEVSAGAGSFEATNEQVHECKEIDVDQPQTSSANQPSTILPDRVAQRQKLFEDYFFRPWRQAGTSQRATPVATNVIGSLSDAVQSSEDKSEASTVEGSFESTNDQGIQRFDFKRDATSQNLYQGVDMLNTDHYHAGVSASGPAAGHYAIPVNPYNGLSRVPAIENYTHLNPYNGRTRVSAVGNYAHSNRHNGLPIVPAVGNYAYSNRPNGLPIVPAIENYAYANPYHRPTRALAVRKYPRAKPKNGTARASVVENYTRTREPRSLLLSRISTGEKSTDSVIASKGPEVPEENSRVSLFAKMRRRDGKRTERRSPSPTVEELCQTLVDALSHL